MSHREMENKGQGFNRATLRAIKFKSNKRKTFRELLDGWGIGSGDRHAISQTKPTESKDIEAISEKLKDLQQRLADEKLLRDIEKELSKFKRKKR